MTAIPEAFEPPSLGKAWGLSVKHLPAFLTVSIVSALVAGLAYGIFAVLGIAVFSIFQSLAQNSSSDSAGLGILAGYVVGGIGALPLLVIWSLLLILLQAIPAIYFVKGEVVAIGQSFGLLMERPWRYILAGILFGIVLNVGLNLCYLPGLAVAIVGPVYINKIFTTDQGVVDAFSSSFSAVYRSEHLWPFIGVQFLVGIVAIVACSCSCLILAFLIIPAASFYVQNVAYRLGILS
jgi:hypothetical protein